LDYKPIIIGAIAGLAVGYFYAKNKNKDVKKFGAVVAIIGAILGYVYSKHQCSPIEILTKLKVPSKSDAATPATPATGTSKYYGGR
jgi:disulfide bond formation protein DsbB